MKEVMWIADSLDVLRGFPRPVKSVLGDQLQRVQNGIDPIHYRPMPSIGSGVQEIKVKYRGEYRLIYVAKFNEAVYVISTFHKKSQKTPKHEIELARARYKELLNSR